MHEVMLLCQEKGSSIPGSGGTYALALLARQPRCFLAGPEAPGSLTRPQPVIQRRRCRCLQAELHVPLEGFQSIWRAPLCGCQFHMSLCSAELNKPARFKQVLTALLAILEGCCLYLAFNTPKAHAQLLQLKVKRMRATSLCSLQQRLQAKALLGCCRQCGGLNTYLSLFFGQGTWSSNSALGTSSDSFSAKAHKAHAMSTFAHQLQQPYSWPHSQPQHSLQHPKAGKRNTTSVVALREQSATSEQLAQ